jgi:hypothetical protein
VRRIVRRPSAAMVVACLALLVALGGTSVAAVSQLVPRNSVGTPQLKRNAVTAQKINPNAVRTGHVLNGSLLAEDFKPGQIPQGPQGAQGPAGPAGPAGPGARWALVGKDGTILAQSGGISMASALPGSYYLNFGSAQTGKLVTATPVYRNDDAVFRGTALVTICGGTSAPDTATCSTANTTSTIWVGTSNTANTATEAHAFYVSSIG